MEKRKRTYDLQALKEEFLSVAQLGRSITSTAFRNAQELGFSREDIVAAIQMLKPSNFYKSMTSYADHRIWQDVYYLEFRGVDLYIKFTAKSEGGCLLISFKEK